ncbi:MAG: hypothetical protein IJV27_01725 [Prevotella sp.]|nr:hypothetical protein [Prevotella sp.]
MATTRTLVKINVLLKQIEPKVDSLLAEINSSYPNKNRIRIECGSISVLMDEIMTIISSSGRSVFLAPYYFKGRKATLQEISSQLAALIETAEKV